MIVDWVADGNAEDCDVLVVGAAERPVSDDWVADDELEEVKGTVEDSSKQEQALEICVAATQLTKVCGTVLNNVAKYDEHKEDAD